MRPEQIEAWVLQLVNQVESGRKVEDSHVELKAEWPEAQKAARRIAGHANASRSDAVLWVIGLDEERGVVAYTDEDLAHWYPQVRAQFEGTSPSVTDLIVPAEGGQLHALLFDTSRRPFVVKNPVYGNVNGGPVAFEVPWREGTETRSARREDLIRILVPLEALPHIEILTAKASSKRAAAQVQMAEFSAVRSLEHLRWEGRLELYVTPMTSSRVVFPLHRAFATFTLSGSHASVTIHPTFLQRDRAGGFSVPESEAIVSSPGRLLIDFRYYEALRPLSAGQALDVIISLTPAGQGDPIKTLGRLVPDAISGDYDRAWKYDND